MHKRIAIGDWRLYISISRRKPVLGVNSDLGDGTHVLLMDFDNVPSGNILQDKLDKWAAGYQLSAVTVVESSPGNYHGYCFQRHSLEETTLILAGAPFIDGMHWRLGVVRGYWTLRISQKGEWLMRRRFATYDYGKPNVDPTELGSFVIYEARG